MYYSQWETMLLPLNCVVERAKLDERYMFIVIRLAWNKMHVGKQIRKVKSHRGRNIHAFMNTPEKSAEGKKKSFK